MLMRRALRWLFAAIIAIAACAVVAVAAFRIAAAWRETAEASQIAPPSGRYVPTRSGRVFLQEAGPTDGVAVVLFHGTAAWSELWRQTMTALAEVGFRAVAIDMPPFGFSDRPGNYTRRDQAERVRDILDQLAVPSAIILGHSFGAGAAAETVLRFPDRVRGLVLVDAALGLSAPAETSTPLVMRYGFARELVVATTITNPLATRFLLAQLIAKKERAANYVSVLQQPMTIRNSTPDLAEWLLYFTSDDRMAMSADRASYARISARTAIIWGDKDTITPLAQAEDLHALIPAATMTVLPGLGHIPSQIEDPDSFNRALIAQLLAIK
jgi:pimeloyl-ACP methyl ester carboxylesterase